MFKYHIFALLMGTILDFVFGRLYSVWNPMVSIKGVVKFLDRALLGDEIILVEPEKQRRLGMWLVILVAVPVFITILFFTVLCYEVAPWFGVIFEAIASYFCLEMRHIYKGGIEVMEDYYADGISFMQRSSEALMEKEIVGNTVQSVSDSVITYIAEEASDSVLSPLFVMFLFGPVGGFLYRTIDIIDGRIGNSNTNLSDVRYQYFGEPVTKINKALDYIPALFSGFITVFVSNYFPGGFNGKNARYIHMRDKYKAVAAFAGALNIALMDGQIGDFDKEISPRDIERAVILMRNSFITCQLILVFLLLFF